MNALDNILFSQSEPGFDLKLQTLREKIKHAAGFFGNDPRAEQLRKIVSDVLANGDSAVASYTEKFDRVTLSPSQFKVSDADIKSAYDSIDPQLIAALRASIANVKKYQKAIFTAAAKPSCPSGTGIKYTPLSSVGICIPGASAPLPSTVIMTAVPAMVAGVKEISLISPPRFNSSIHPVILALCYELANDTDYTGCRFNVYRIGGAQAVAALASGTATIKKVDKIVGPGNQWVQMAKKEVFGLVDIDSIAGPSEVLILADSSANPAWVAADILSQAEHAPGSAIVFTDSKQLAELVLAELKTQAAALGRSQQTLSCLSDFSGIAVFDSLDSAVPYANDFAAEHLQIQCGSKSHSVSEKIQNAGAIFIGSYSPVAVGDYFAGPSHTLPTGTSAKFFSPLSSNDFVKSTSIIEYNQEMLSKAADKIIMLAKTEGLDAHAKSTALRKQP